jgi:hypothetical protein
MRYDPLFTSWIVRCASPEDARYLQQWLGNQIAPDAVFEDVVGPSPGSQATSAVEHHRLGDYFAEIRQLPGDPGDPASFRILFHRRPDASRYWKDLIARVLQSIRQATDSTTTTLEFRGDEEPKTLETGR